MGTPEPYRSVGWALSRLGSYMEAVLATVNLTPRQYRMLVAIAEGPVSATALAQRVAVSPPSVTLMVGGLIRRGAVERTVSEEDQRRVWLSLSVEGEALLASVERAIEERLAEIAEDFPEKKLGEVALSSLASWNVALDGFRSRRFLLRSASAGDASESPRAL